MSSYKYILISGGHSGIGLEVTKRLILRGCHVGLIVRNEERKEEAISKLSHRTNVEYFIGDLSNREDIKAITERIELKWPKVNGIFNNAGVLLDSYYVSNYGNEMHLEINAISPYLLTQSLKSMLDKAVNPFVINTVTAGLHKRKEIQIPELIKPEKFNKLNGSYMDSKYTLVLMMNSLARDWENVRIMNIDPGYSKTKLTEGPGMPSWLIPFRNLFYAPPERGAKRLFRGAFSRSNRNKTGIYISNSRELPIRHEIDRGQIDQLLEVRRAA